MVPDSSDMTRFSQLEKIIKGRNLFFSNDYFISTLCIDSRKAQVSEETLFFAIRGERHDGHAHIRTLYQAGIRQFVVEQLSEDFSSLQGANVILVHSCVDALQKLASCHRHNFSIPVIGITGSNGKTITKEWLSQMLSKDRIVVKSPGSYNSQVGVPLSVWQLQSHHQIAIFEAGISRPGEMEKLEKVIKPSIGIFTNIGSAHDEGFKSYEEKITEKLKLFKSVNVLIYCRDHEQLHTCIGESAINTFSWGSSSLSDVCTSFRGNTCFVQLGKERFELHMPFTDKASLENCLHCVTLMIWMGFPLPKIQELVHALRAIPMRMELKEGINQCQLIDDTYNNDLGGLERALQFLTHQNQKKKKRLILSDILESGMGNEDLAKKIAALVHQNNITYFVGIGPVLCAFQALFPPLSTFYHSTSDFLRQFEFDLLQQEAILVKGARSFTFEKIVRRLQRKVHGTVMEIDLDNLVHNLNFFKSKLKPLTKIMVMVKAFAYGSGSVDIANILQYHKTDYLGVAYADEGVELRKNNISLPIMVMNPSEDSFDTIFQYDLEPEIYSLRIFDSLLNHLQGNVCKIHVKLDTGMHRLGFDDTTVNEMIRLIKLNSNIKVASVFSHLAGADEAEHDTFSRHQFDTFMRWADQISIALGYRPSYHILNSPGILRLVDYQLDMVRLGIGLYGVDPTHEGFTQLKPVATLKTVISQIKHVKQGESIGYGRKGLAEKDATIATIAIGYADGFSRSFSNGVGEVLIHDQRAKVIGNVCMDMTMIDVTGLKANEGDEVILFGKEYPIQQVAEKIHTIPYEILTSTSERVKRVFVADGI
jgi:Alr-MurF fusion protein